MVQQDLILSTEAANQGYLKHGFWYLCHISIFLPSFFSFSLCPPPPPPSYLWLGSGLVLTKQKIIACWMFLACLSATVTWT